MTDTQIFAALNDTQIFALTLFGEARGERVEGRVAVGSVIRNRVASGRFGMGYRGVCLRPLQFSCWNEDGSANHETMLTAARVLVADTLPGPALRECLWVAHGVIADKLADRVDGSTHYLTSALFQAGTVGWAKGLRPTAVVGAHVFFAGVA